MCLKSLLTLVRTHLLPHINGRALDTFWDDFYDDDDDDNDDDVEGVLRVYGMMCVGFV